MKTMNLSSMGLAMLLAAPVQAAYSAAPDSSPATVGLVAETPGAPPPTALSRNASEVARLASARMSDEVILGYVKNCSGSFGLSADAILALKESGVTSTVLAAMLNHDSALREQGAPAPYIAPYNYNQRLYGGASPTQPMPPAPPALQYSAPPPQQYSAPPQQYSAPPAGMTPPPLQTEVVPASPGADYYWSPGYWGWNGGWVWVGGSWLPGVGIGVGLGWPYWGWGGYWGWPGWGWGWGGRGWGWGGYRGGFGGGWHGGGGFHGGGGSHGGGGFGGHGGGHR